MRPGTQSRLSGAALATWDMDAIVLRGWASVFDVVDSYNTTFRAGAFARTLEEQGGVVPMFYGHNVWRGFFESGTPIGLARAEERDYGLWYEARITPTQEGLEVAALVRDGVIASSSHTFYPRRSETETEEMDDGTELRLEHFTDVDLVEISPVVWGANPEATVELAEMATAANDDGDEEVARAFLQALEQWAA